MIRPALDSESLRSRLKLKHLTSQTTLLSHHPHVRKLLASGAIAGSLLLSPGQPIISKAALPAPSTSALVSTFDLHHALATKLKDVLPPVIEPLDENKESQISNILHQVYGIHASASLEGNKLNTSYGYIGAEQNLARYPGDNVPNMAPGRGAWGYFSYSRGTLTEEDIEREKYYVAVQTLYLPDWHTRLAYLRDWYKYRKVAVVNPKNGKAIIAVIADSGPAWWTGKTFGGSPEVMDYLQMKDGKQKGPVVLFFVDDPENKVQLGPLEQNLEKGPPLLSRI